MQKLVVLTSLVSSASGAVAFPRADKRIHRAVKREQVAIREALKISTTEKKSAQILSAQSELKTEAVVKPKDIENDPIRFFEVSMASGADCRTDMGRVQGMEVGRCTNTLSRNNPGDSVAHAMSEMWYKPNNGGFPIMATFFDHGCDWEKLLHVSRMSKQDFGFPPEYRAGNCIPVYGESSEPMFHMEAHWTDMRHEPKYNAILEGNEGRYNACMNDKYTFYGVYNADLCMEDEDMYGYPNGLFTKADVTNCNNEGAKSVDFLQFSDPECTVPSGTPHTEHGEYCVFDVNDFNDEMNYDQYAHIEYRSRDCHKEPEMPPV